MNTQDRNHNSPEKILIKKNNILEVIDEDYSPNNMKSIDLINRERRYSTNEEKDKDLSLQNIPEYVNSL